MPKPMKQITSLQNPLVKHLVKLRQNRDYRHEHRRVFIEGIKPVQEIGKEGSIEILIVRDPSLIPKDVNAKEIYLVDESILKKISGVQTPEGVIAEVLMPKPASFKNIRRLIAFDHINDPGNLGALIRTALALGWEGAFFIGETCDPFNEKCLRASRGAVFRLPLAFGSLEDFKTMAEENSLSLFAADLEGKALEEIQTQISLGLVIGNEARGISPEIKRISKSVTIPMPGPMESLNAAVAGGIIMYVMSQKSKQ